MAAWRRAKEAGAKTLSELNLGVTTHVIAARDFDAHQAAALLQDVPEDGSVKYYNMVGSSLTHFLTFWCCLIPCVDLLSSFHKERGLYKFPKTRSAMIVASRSWAMAIRS